MKKTPNYDTALCVQKISEVLSIVDHKKNVASIFLGIFLFLIMSIF